MPQSYRGRRPYSISDILFLYSEQKSFQRLAVKGYKRIEIASLSVDGGICSHKCHGQRKAPDKAPKSKYRRQDKEHYSEEFYSVTQFIASLRKVGYGDKGHIEYDLGNKPADIHREIAKYQATHDGQ